MSLHIRDTDALTLYQSGHPVLVQRVRQCRSDELALTIISVEEELTGWYTKLRRAKKKEQLARAYQRLTDAVRFFSGLSILSFTESAVAGYSGYCLLFGPWAPGQKTTSYIPTLAMATASYGR